jgi:acid phosphatase family membrane protein YuiD
MSLSPYLIAVLASWFIAQGAKYLIVALKNKDFTAFRNLYLSGNMPSAHTATVVSIATVIGLSQGIDTAIFGLAATFAAVVMYDAIMVRRTIPRRLLRHRILFPR